MAMTDTRGIMRRLLPLGVLLGVLLGASLALSAAREPWQRLPATPELPAGTRGQYAAVNGVRIWYAEWGRTHRGTPVLLLHGGLANANYFGHLVATLLAHGYHVIAMDSRGHGRSTRDAQPYSYHLMATDVVALLDLLAIRRVALVGWSDGGCIGYDLALNHPERLERLFAFGANSDVSGARDDVDKDPVFSAYFARTQQEYRRLSPTPDEWDAFSAAVGRMWATEPHFTAGQLRSLHLPVTIADGEHDEALKPEHIRYVAAAIPGARLVFLPGVSHFAMLQNPRAFAAAVLTFLSQP